MDQTNRPWWREKPVWIMLALGFSAGIPILLIFSSLSLWLSEAGVNKSTVTFFSWAALGYSFKFVWAPLVDKLPLPWLGTVLGRRRSWLMLAQCMVIVAIVWMALIDPKSGLLTMAIAAVLLGFSSATQDIVIDALRIELASPRLQAMLASTYIAGYRVATLLAGAGVLYLAQWFGSTKLNYSYDAWSNAYLCMALMMSVGLLTTLLIAEPKSQQADNYPYPAQDYVRLFLVFALSVLALIGVFALTPALSKNTGPVLTFMYRAVELSLALGSAFGVAFMATRAGWINPQLVEAGYRAPITDFLRRYAQLSWWILLLVGCYRISDIVLGVIANVFYQDMGYSKAEIASVTKVFGVVMTITGSFVGGLLVMRIGIMRMLAIGALLVALTNLLFVWLAQIEPDISYLSIVIAADNLSQGLAIAAFIAWLSSLTNNAFTATQYAIFSSLMTLFPKLLGGYSGTLVETFGYSSFFLFTTFLGLPVLLLIYFVKVGADKKAAAST